MSLEKIIRPFQTREITPPRSVVSPAKASEQTSVPIVTFTIGQSPSIKMVTGSESIDVSYYMERWMKEKKQ